ncbi:MAG: GFA family protein [Microcoleaceae cyanobacterium]
METQTKPYAGGCFCSNIRYQILSEPVWVGHCHCNICRRFSGSAFATIAFFPKTQATFQGELSWFRSSEHGERGFCPNCGVHVAYRDANWPDLIEVTLGSLDDPNAVDPQENIWVSDRLQWLHLNDGLPEYPENPPMDTEAITTFVG